MKPYMGVSPLSMECRCFKNRPRKKAYEDFNINFTNNHLVKVKFVF